MTITFINRFTLNGATEEFERAFTETAEFIRKQPGLLRYTLSRDVGKANSYVNIALRESAQSLRDRGASGLRGPRFVVARVGDVRVRCVRGAAHVHRREGRIDARTVTRPPCRVIHLKYGDRTTPTVQSAHKR